MRIAAIAGIFLLVALVFTNRAENPGATAVHPGEMPSLPGTSDENLLGPLPVGSQQLRILTPTLLELTLVTTKAPDPATVTDWNFVHDDFTFVPPKTSEFNVTADGKPITIKSIGFKRRPVYAPVKERDLRIGNHLYLELAQSLHDGEVVEVKTSGSASALAVGRASPRAVTTESSARGNPRPTDPLTPALSPSDGARVAELYAAFTATMSPLRYSPAIHIDQVGYLPNFPKQAIIGYYAGSYGEIDVPATNFFLLEVVTGKNVFEGRLRLSLDKGFAYSPKPYQNVYEADFSRVTNSGEYQIVVPGLGASFPFLIDDGVAMAFARAYALGLYEQRCGTSNELPFTRFTHDACHTAPADVPVPESKFTNTWHFIAMYGSQFVPDHPHQTAPWLTNENRMLYPFGRKGAIDVSGGHHDAGDYSKYTSNSAQLIHDLMFAVDSIPGVADLDNLGIPESGDGISDVMQEAKWEADFLAKMQDTDGGFYFLVYPRDREYESDVTPDHGYPQVVWPKNTSVTADAVAALAECASSPRFKKTYPDAARDYLAKAQLGWRFLTNAIAKHGKDGAYQKITTYSDDFADQDDLAWAACEMFLATGDGSIHRLLQSWFPNPADPKTFRWGWWRMYACYGNAIRDYAFAARSGRVRADQLDPNYLAQCENQVLAAGDDALKWSQDNAYGSSFPPENKAFRNAGWYFSSVQAFDIVVAYQLQPKPDYLDAILRNVNYEGGCNPVNVTYVTGLGWKRQREIVDQYSQNDGHILPKSGIPLGNIQAGFEYLGNYGRELGELCFPPDGAVSAPYPFYDRWGDAYNTTTEFTVLDLARDLGSLAFMASLTPLKTQQWKSGEAQITGVPAGVMTGSKVTVGLDVSERGQPVRESLAGEPPAPLQIVWEATGAEPAFGTNYTFTATTYGTNRIEAEIQWPDGRRVFAVTNFFVTNDLPTVSVTVDHPQISISDGKPVVLTFTRAGKLNQNLTVNYSLTGTAVKWNDYRAEAGDMPVAVTIPSGQRTATLSVYAKDNSTGADPETVILTLLPDNVYNVGSPDSVTVKITK